MVGSLLGVVLEGYPTPGRHPQGRPRPFSLLCRIALILCSLANQEQP